jgi:hypothetical protein
MFRFFSNATCVERRLIFFLSTRMLRCYKCNKLQQNAWLWNDERINDKLIRAIPFSLPLPLPLPPSSPSFTWFQYNHHCRTLPNTTFILGVLLNYIQIGSNIALLATSGAEPLIFKHKLWLLTLCLKISWGWRNHWKLWTRNNHQVMKLLKVIKFVHEAESEKLKEFISGLSHQQNSLL